MFGKYCIPKYDFNVYSLEGSELICLDDHLYELAKNYIEYISYWQYMLCSKRLVALIYFSFLLLQIHKLLLIIFLISFSIFVALIIWPSNLKYKF